MYMTAFGPKDPSKSGYRVIHKTREELNKTAINFSDFEVLAFVLKFFNSYLRICLNANDVRTAYNILHQYRQLAYHVGMLFY